jgi:hypothetical protein
VARRADLAREVEGARTPEAAAGLDEVAARRASTRDELAREAYARAEAALRDRAARDDVLRRALERIDARLAAAVAELESTAFALATRAPEGDAGPGGASAALAAACDRLRAAGVELGAETEALAEVGAL